MNTFEFKKTIIDIVREYPANKVARIFALNNEIYSQSRDNLFENLLNIYETNSLDDLEISYDNIEIDESINIDEIKNKDFRIRALTISNLRGFPSIEDSELIPYGIDFTNNQTIDSILILANNGTGKSSLFNAIEYTFTNQIGEKRIRSMQDNMSVFDYEQYLYRFNSNSKPIFEIDTVNGSYSIYNKIFDDKLLKYINPKCNFISEHDIISFGKTDYNYSSNSNHSFHNIIAKSLGLEEYIDFSNKLSELNSYKRRKDVATRNSINKEISLLNENLNSRQDLLKKIEEQTANFKSNNEIKINSINDELSKTIETAQNSKPTFTILSKDLDEDINKFKSIFNRFRFDEKNRVNLDELSFLEKGESILHLHNDCPFCLNSKLEFNDLKKNVDERIVRLKNISNQQIILKDLFKKITTTLNTV